MNALTPTPNLQEAVEHLNALDRAGFHHLTAISPEGAGAGIEGKLFPPGPTRPADVCAWVSEINARQWNVYYSVNEPTPNAPDKKLGKADIARIRAIGGDVDPRLPPGTDMADTPEAAAIRRRLMLEARNAVLEDARRIATGPNPPSITLDSGNGAQFLWLLTEKLDAKAENARHALDAEDQGRGVAAVIGGDAVGNIDRILRLPGTVNYPDAGKRRAGKVGGPVRIMAVEARRYGLHDLAKAYPPVAKSTSVGDEAEQAAMAGLDLEAALAATPDHPSIVKVLEYRKANPELRALLAGTRHPDDTSGSGYRAALVGELAKRPNLFTVQDYATFVTHWGPGDPKDGTFTARMLARDWANVATGHAAEFEKGKAMLGPVDDEEPDTSDFPSLEAKPRPALVFTPFAEAVEQGRKAGLRPLVKGLLNRGTTGVLYGPSNVGKTFLAMLLNYCVSRGLPFGGMRTVELPVLYVATEGHQGARLRADALLRAFGPAPNFHFLFHVIDLFDPNADTGPLIEAINANLPGAGLVSIDTFARSMGAGDENSGKDMAVMNKHVARISAETGATVLIVHHTGKDETKGARGHSALRAAIDTEIEVTDGQIRVTKQRDIDKGWGSSFALDVVTLWTDDDGDKVTTCVARLVEKRQELPRTPLTPAEQQVYDALEACAAASEDPAKGVSTGEIVAALEGVVKASTVRPKLPILVTKQWVEAVKRGQWRPRGAADNLSTSADAGAFFEVIEEPETDLFE